MTSPERAHRVLVVDTAAHPTTRLIPWILGEAGHDVVVAMELGEAERIAAYFAPDVVILDPDNRPADAVHDAVEMLRRAASHARIIGLAPAPDIVPALHGVDEVQRMPFDAEDLLRRVAGDQDPPTHDR